MNMKVITADDPETKSADIIAENIERLKELFPEVVTEDGVNVDVLQQLIGRKPITDAEEKYGLNWHGKRKARQLALTPSTGTLRPCPEDSVDWDTTQNLMIEGDNLEVLKLLQKSYAGKVKMIYIDPPYNTGKDFVYQDNFQDNIKNYQELTGQVDGGQKISSNTESSGRFHTDWLNMMYPRLKLSRNLLREDGVIFISIDDNELSNLRELCNDVFGEENFIDCLIWRKIYGIKNDSTMFSKSHDYIIVYSRNTEIWRPNLLPRTEKQNERYKNPDNDIRGPWKSGDFTGIGETQSCIYSINTPGGRLVTPPQGKRWIVAENTFEQLVNDNRIWFGPEGTNVPAIKRFLSEVKDGIIQSTFLDYTEVGHSDEANKELKTLLGGSFFDYPKPTRLLYRLVHLGSNNNDIILDFFAGSGTTGHAIMTQNADNNSNRHYILVQLPEHLDPKNKDQKIAADFCDMLKKPRNIAELTKERLRRAGTKIKADNPLFAGDTGFRVFKLDSSNIRAWDPSASDLGC